MNRRPPHPIIVIDDEESILLSVDTTLRMAGFKNIITCQDSRKAAALIAENSAGVILLDLTMPHISGQELLTEITTDFPEIPIIINTVEVDTHTAVACIRKGAFDYLVKPVEPKRLVTTVMNALHFSELQRENMALKDTMLTQEGERPSAFSDIITANPKMLSLFNYLGLISVTNHPVLITGETGVGKELVARSVHRLSGLSGEFVSVNVAGLDDNIFADTLFGHVKGAYTGATGHRQGLVEQAFGGTLLLDEIGDLSHSSQVKLLRLLQEAEYRPLGMDRTKKANVRVVASTNQTLNSLRTSGKFRKDLLFRLQTHHVHIPPLRERPDDIPLLLDHFIREAATELKKNAPTCPRELVGLLQTYAFPGNVRELQAMVVDAVSRHDRGILSMGVFSDYISIHYEESAGFAIPGEVDEIIFPAHLPTIEEATQALVFEAMKRAGGNQSLAARLLGISQQAISKRLKKMGDKAVTEGQSGRVTE